MELARPTVSAVALRYGAATGVAAILYSAILMVAGLNTSTGLTSLGYVIPIVGIVLAMRAFKTANLGYMSYGQGLGIGTLLSGIMGVLVSIFTLLYMKFIDTTIMQQSLDRVREDMERKGMDDAQIEAAMQFSGMVTSPGAVFAIGIVTYLFIGFIVSLIIAAIMRRDEPIFE